MKKIKYLLPIFLMVFVFVGCKQKKKDLFEDFTNAIAESEKSYTAYVEKDEIKQNEEVYYTKEIHFEIMRVEEVRTKYVKTEKTINQNEVVTSYKTIGSKKYDDNQNQSDYEVPEYWLTFHINKDYFEEGYHLDAYDNKDYTLTAKVKEASVNTFFMEDNLSFTNLNITIEVKDKKLTKFMATYTSKNGFSVSMVIEYSYNSVTIE